MKVAIIVAGFSAHERDWCIPALSDFVRAASAQTEAHVFTLRWPEREETYDVHGATVHALGGREHLGPRVFSLWARAFKAIADEHRHTPFDVLHAFWADEPGWVAALAGRQLGIPVVISLAGGELIKMKDIGYGAQLLPGRGALIDWAMRSAECVTAGSDTMVEIARRRLGKWEKGRLKKAPLGVDTAIFSRPPSPPSDPSATLRACFARKNAALRSGRPATGPGLRIIGSNDFSRSAKTATKVATTTRFRDLLIINVGSLTPVKNQAMLLRAVARAPGVRLKIVGEGPLRGELQRLAAELGIADRVRFAGEIDHGQMPAVYHAADLFAQSSRHEAQGMAVLEAAACGLPVIGTAVGVLPEIGQAVKDEVEMAEAIQRCGCQPVSGEAMKEFGLEEAVRRFVGIYGEVR